MQNRCSRSVKREFTYFLCLLWNCPLTCFCVQLFYFSFSVLFQNNWFLLQNRSAHFHQSISFNQLNLKMKQNHFSNNFCTRTTCIMHAQKLHEHSLLLILYNFYVDVYIYIYISITRQFVVKNWSINPKNWIFSLGGKCKFRKSHLSFRVAGIN